MEHQKRYIPKGFQAETSMQHSHSLKGEGYYKQARFVTWIGMLVNLILSIFKVALGLFGHSQALFADGIHSLSDLVTDVMVLIGVKYGSQGPDTEHPYGHARIETIVTVILAILLAVVAVGIALDAIFSIYHQKFIKPNIWVLIAAIISVIANEFLFRFTLIVGDRLHSSLLKANAWHHRTDAWSSFVVVLGISADMLGFRYFDAIAAMIVAGFIMKIGGQMLWGSIKELIDTGLDRKSLTHYENAIAQVPGVLKVAYLKTRLLGGRVFVETGICVDGRISVSEGHFIGEEAANTLKTNFSQVLGVSVHVDPEGESEFKRSNTLPKRPEIEAKLQERWKDLPAFSHLARINLHYLKGGVDIELFFPYAQLESVIKVRQLIDKYRKAASDLVFISSVNFYFY